MTYDNKFPLLKQSHTVLNVHFVLLHVSLMSGYNKNIVYNVQ